MIFQSIKWRLQIWYGLILVAVLAGFGFTAFQLERNLQLRRLDDELQRRFGALANALHGPNQGGPPFGRPPPGPPPEDGPPGETPGPPPAFRLPPRLAAMFDATDPNDFYFVVQLRGGRELARSINAPEAENVPPIDGATGGAPQARTLGHFRSMLHVLPSGESVWVGCSVVPEWRELRVTALKLSAIGGVILLLGLAGGWWISGRAIRPIADISATAVKISAGDLGQRINSAETESELGQLATVLNSAFARLEAAFAQQRQFAADAAHELRTPVAVMLTQTQTALNRQRNAAEYRETVEACQRAAQRMRGLIAALLELARLDAGQERMKRAKFDLSQTARECVELIGALAGERGVKIRCDLPPAQYVGDPERLAQVITNLLTNAIQYNRENGEVRISVQAQTGAVTLAVSDTGVGIAAADLPHVFERFYRADQSRSSANHGLGLAISKAIVEAHGGMIDISSQEKVGTTFTVRLP
jgi:two-component system, OmpR family, sensor kinase